MGDSDRARDRAKSVMTEFTDQVGVSDDAWAQVRGRIDNTRPARTPRFWWGLGLAGAAAAAVAVIGFAALNSGDDGPTVAGPQSVELEPGFVALTVDGELRRFSPTGEDLGLITDTEWGFVDDDDYPAPPGFSVAPDGTVYLAGSTRDPDCDTSSLDTKIVAVPLEGGEPEVVASHASSPAVSPDGNSLAYLAGEGEFPCGSEPPSPSSSPSDYGVTLKILDLSTLDSDSPRVTDLGPVLSLTGSSPAWSPDGASLAVSEMCLECPEGERAGVTVHPVDGSEPHRVVATDLSAGPNVAFAGPDELYVDASIFGDFARIGLVPTDVTTPTVLREATVTFEIPDAYEIHSLSTLAGANAPGLLAVVERQESTNGAGDAQILVEGEDSAPPIVASEVVDAVWIPGTTASDLL